MTKVWHTIRYWHPKIGPGRMTMIFDLNLNQFAIAWCNPEDQFSKKRGRQIAFGRLKKKPMRATQCFDEPPMERMRKALSLVISSDKIPKWYRESLEEQKGAEGPLEKGV